MIDPSDNQLNLHDFLEANRYSWWSQVLDAYIPICDIVLDYANILSYAYHHRFQCLVMISIAMMVNGLLTALYITHDSDCQTRYTTADVCWSVVSFGAYAYVLECRFWTGRNRKVKRRSYLNCSRPSNQV